MRADFLFSFIAPRQTAILPGVTTDKPCPGLLRRRALLRRCAGGVGIIALVFSLTVFTLLVAARVQSTSLTPSADSAHSRLLAAARAADATPELVSLARDADAAIRHAYFVSTAFQTRALWLLVIGLMITALCLHTAWRLDVKLANPRNLPQGDNARALSNTRIAFGVVIFLLFAVGIALNIRMRLIDSEEAADDEPDEPLVAVTPTADKPTPATPPPVMQIAGPEPQILPATYFRAPVPADAAPKGLPVVKWKVPLTTAGFNTPAIIDGKIFISEAGKKECRVVAYALDDGKLLWSTVIPDASGGKPLPTVMDDTGLAAPSPAADTERIYAIFATGDVAALDHNGKIVWQRHLGRPRNTYGHASSLILAEGLLIVQWLQSDDPCVMALNPRSGTIAWKTPIENAGPAWSSPIAINDLVVCSGHEKAIFLNAADGKIRWSGKGVGGEVAVSPAYLAPYLVLMNELSKILVLDVTNPDDPKTVWENPDLSLPDVSSPAMADGLIYFANNGGEVYCYALEKDEEVWTHEFDESFYSSPVVAGGHLYVIDREGVLFVLKPGREFEELRKLALGEKIDATPVFVNGKMIVRGTKNLFCLGDE